MTQAAVTIIEQRRVTGIDAGARGFAMRDEAGSVARGTRVVLAGGVWLGVTIAVKCLINQLIVTERVRPVMPTVFSVASGLLSLKQFRNGTVLIGGGRQGLGDPARGGVETVPDNLIGNMRLARWTVPELAEARIARISLGLFRPQSLPWHLHGDYLPAGARWLYR